MRWIVFRTRRGNVVDLPGTQAAFEIDHIDDDKREGWSVVVRGTMARVDPKAAAFRERF